MATGTLTSTITATLTLDNTEYNVTNATSIVNVTNATRRRVTVPTASEVNLVEIAATVGSGTLTDIDYLLIVNRDSTNFCRIRFADTGADTFDIKLKPGENFLYYSVDLNVSATEGAYAAFSSLDKVAAQFDTADGDLEVLVAEI